MDKEQYREERPNKESQWEITATKKIRRVLKPVDRDEVYMNSCLGMGDVLGTQEERPNEAEHSADDNASQPGTQGKRPNEEEPSADGNASQPGTQEERPNEEPLWQYAANKWLWGDCHAELNKWLETLPDDEKGGENAIVYDGYRPTLLRWRYNIVAKLQYREERPNEESQWEIVATKKIRRVTRRVLKPVDRDEVYMIDQPWSNWLGRVWKPVGPVDEDGVVMID